MNALELKLSAETQTALEAEAQKHARSPEDEARALLEAALTIPQLDIDVQQLSVTNDGQLWRVARLQVAKELNERMQILVEKQQREGLTALEVAETQTLQRYGQQVMRLRAEAAALLKQRGQDVSLNHLA